LLAMMGIFDIVRHHGFGMAQRPLLQPILLFAYYLLRGLSLLFLPHTLAHAQSGLNWFAIFYGLDWVATIPPTVRLTSDAFGRENSGVIYGWIVASHQLGAALAAFGAGSIRTAFAIIAARSGFQNDLFPDRFAFLFARKALGQSFRDGGSALLSPAPRIEGNSKRREYATGSHRFS